MIHHIYAITLHSLVTFICGAVTLLVFFQLRRDQVGRYFMALMALNTLATFSLVLIRIFSLTGLSILLPFYVGVIAYVALSPVGLAFTAEYFNAWTPGLRWLARALVVEIPFALLLIVTGLFFRSIRITPEGSLVYPLQPLGYLLQISGETGPLAALYLLLKRVRTATGQDRYVVWGMIVMWVGALCILIPPIYQWTGSIYLAVTALLITGPILKLRLFDPLSRLNQRLEHQTHQLNVITLVGQQAALLLNLDKLLNSVIWDIQQAFGFYGVTICLPDSTGQMVAHMAAGERSHELNASKLRLAVDVTSPIGEAALSHQLVYVNDVQRDGKYTSHGLRSDARSEVSIPLIIGSSSGQEEVLVGVLDIHDKKANAFMPEDLSVLQILGREIAIAIRNAQLFDEIQRVDAAKTNFISYMGHEVRNPITNILHATETILKYPEIYRDAVLPNQYREDIGDIESEAQHLRNLMDDILDLSKIEAGKVEMSIRAVNPVPILRYVEQQTAASLHNGVSLECLYGDQLPAILADDLRLRQVLINLIGNAVKFTKQGKITLDAQVTDGKLCFSVSDTGPGISPEAQVRLFHPYIQASMQISRDYGGTGLGLTISKQLVELQGGALWLESQVDRGTTFFFTIPLASE